LFWTEKVAENWIMARLVVSIVVLSLSSLAAVAQSSVPGPWSGHVVVLIADGAGDSTALSDRLSDVIGERALGITLRRVPWSRFGTVELDYRDNAAQLAAADQLAQYVQVLRQARPDCRIVFIGHSAGTRVILAAAEKLPPGGVERIILLSSSVAWSYDLSAALRASTGGIDSFYSPYDATLAGTLQAGTSEGVTTYAAGQIGFRCPPGSPWAGLYYGLRQYRWDESLRGQGGHFVWTLPYNLRAYVLPLIQNAPPPSHPALTTPVAR
jgi:pimeloyl-ACP methyl ester carboxylesterase